MYLNTKLRRGIVVLGITGLLFGGIFNLGNLLGGIGIVVNSVLETLGLRPTLDQQVQSTQYYVPPKYVGDIQRLDEIVSRIEPGLGNAQGPKWVNENVYAAVIEDGYLLYDYQVKVVDGKPVCYGKTPKTGGTAQCGKPTLWIRLDTYALNALYYAPDEEKPRVAFDLIMQGHIDAYPKGKALDYLGKISQ